MKIIRDHLGLITEEVKKKLLFWDCGSTSIQCRQLCQITGTIEPKNCLEFCLIKNEMGSGHFTLKDKINLGLILMIRLSQFRIFADEPYSCQIWLLKEPSGISSKAVYYYHTTTKASSDSHKTSSGSESD